MFQPVSVHGCAWQQTAGVALTPQTLGRECTGLAAVLAFGAEASKREPNPVQPDGAYPTRLDLNTKGGGGMPSWPICVHQCLIRKESELLLHSLSAPRYWVVGEVSPGLVRILSHTVSGCIILPPTTIKVLRPQAEEAQPQARY